MNGLFLQLLIFVSKIRLPIHFSKDPPFPHQLILDPTLPGFSLALRIILLKTSIIFLSHTIIAVNNKQINIL